MLTSRDALIVFFVFSVGVSEMALRVVVDIVTELMRLEVKILGVQSIKRIRLNTLHVRLYQSF